MNPKTVEHPRLRHRESKVHQISVTMETVNNLNFSCINHQKRKLQLDTHYFHGILLGFCLRQYEHGEDI